MNHKNLIISFILSFLIFFLYSFVFFGNVLISLCLSLALSFKFKTLFLDYFEKKDQYKKRAMLRDFLDILNSSISSGKNFFESLKDSREELNSFYGTQELIYKELNTLILNIENGHRMNYALECFRDALKLEEADVFVDSLIIGLASGMDINELIENSKFAINEQINVENEIANSLNNSKRELIIMMVLPIIILFMLKRTDLRALTIIDYIVRTIVFAVIIIAIYIGEKIVKLEL